MNPMKFSVWLDTFMDEKNVNLNATFDFETADQFHVMPYAAVTEAIKAAPSHEQSEIQKMLVKIDFTNASVTRYLRHLGRGMASQPAQKVFISRPTQGAK